MTLREVRNYYAEAVKAEAEELRQLALAVQIGAAAALGSKPAQRWLRGEEKGATIGGSGDG